MEYGARFRLISYWKRLEGDYYVSERLESDYPKINLLVVKNTLEALKALSFGSVDAYVGIQGPANAIIEKNALTNLEISGEAKLGDSELRFAVRNDWPIFLEILNKSLNNIPKTEIVKLRRQWLGVAKYKKAQTLSLSPEEQQWLNNHNTIRFAGDPDWLPYEAFDSHGNYIGIVAEYLKLIEQKLGIKIEIIQTNSWTESIDKVKAGEIDILSETIDSDLNEKLLFTQPYLSSPVVIVMDEEHDYVESIVDIEQKKIAIIKNYGYVTSIKTLYPQLNYQTVHNIKEGLTKVSTGEVDAMLATLAQASYHISDSGINNVRIVGKTEFNTQMAFGMREGFSQLTTLFNRAINNISPLEKRRILAIWGKQQFVTKIDYSLLFKIAGALIFLNALFFYWNRKLKSEVEKREASERETQELNQRFALATKTVSLGVWQWDLSTTNTLIIDDRMSEIYEIPHRKSISFAEWINKVHPDDHQMIEAALSKLKEAGGQQELEFRILRPNGGLRYIYSAATISIDQNDGSTKLFGVNWDITERKLAEEQFKSIIEAMPLAVLIADLQGNILLDNPQAIKEIGGKQSLIGRNTLEFYADPEEKKRIFELLKNGGEINQYQVKYKISEHLIIDCLISILPVNYLQQPAWLGVVVNLTDRIKTEQALALAKENAERSSKAKSEFLANMSHEIRTPMNAIIGFTELLNEQVKEPRLRAYVKTIHSAGNTLLTLINDILDLSKIEAGKMEIEKTPVNPHDFFSESGNIFLMNIRKKGLQLILQIDPEIPVSLMLDATRFRQVLFNLIGNAVKFTQSGQIKLKATTANEDQIHSKLDLVIEVQDTGIGIAAEDQDKIFSEFTQSENQDHQKYGGTGLGLSITRRLLQLMGGEISVSSQLGLGSTFTINLNNVDVASVKSQAIPKREKLSATVINFSPAVVLVVDDIASNRDLVKENLNVTKLQVVEAKDGQEAVDKAKEQNIDLILMDLRMPVMNGYQAAEKIKSFKNVPIVALTASVMKDEHEKIKGEHFDGYLRKPVLRKNLFQELSRFLDHQVIEQDTEESTRLMLTETEQKILPEVLEKLEQLNKQCDLVQKNNKISEIGKFASQLIDIAESYDFKPLHEYANGLNKSISVFDITTINERLKQFSGFQMELQDWL